MVSVDLHKSVEECVSQLGAEVIDLVVRGEGNQPVVEVFVDSPREVTSELCATLSRGIADMIEARNLIHGAYRLTVSSPGIDRPLKFAWQYGKHIGRSLQIRVRTGESIERVAGKLISANEREILLDRGQHRAAYPLDQIVEARVKLPW
jgi:ribosome maturation factor RimP